MFVYFVSANVKDEPFASLEMFKNVNSLQELKIKSKKFDSYSECIDVASKLARTLVDELNAKGAKYSIFVDENPEFADQEEVDTGEDIPAAVNPLRGIGLLGQWVEPEIVRYYLIDSDHRDSRGALVTKFIISVLTTQENPQ